jgi:hypothetical protein
MTTQVPSRANLTALGPPTLHCAHGWFDAGHSPSHE